MKVLMIDHFLPANTYTKELCNELSKYCDITVLTKRDYKDDNTVSWKVKPCLYYPDLKNKLLSLCFIICGWLHIVWEICFGKYDVIHVQSFKVDRIEMLLYSMLAKNKLVHTAHNILPHEAKKKDIKKYKNFYKKCDIIIAHNYHSKKLLEREYGIREKVKVMPHGTYMLAQKGKETVKQCSRIEMLMLGSFRKYKGIDILLNALSQLDENARRKIHVTIAGKQYRALDNTDYDELIKSYGIEDIVTLIPKHISDEDLGVLYHNASACLFPYREIYGSGALLMAYTYEKPVIVSDVEGFIEETNGGKTGLVFESENAYALKCSIEEFSSLSEDKINEFRRNIRVLVRDRYNWNTSAKVLFGYYNAMRKIQGEGK